MKIPEQKVAKPSDWRDNSGKPSMARVEQLEGVVASSEARGVSGSSLVQSGVLKEELEPRPKWHLAAFILVPIIMLATIVFGIVYVIQTAGEEKQEKFMADALKDMQENTDTPLPKDEPPLFRAMLYIAAGEYAARQDEPARTKEAIAHFEHARQELTLASSSTVRDFLFSELAVAQLNLGGEEEQVLGQQKIRWQQGRVHRGSVEGKIYNVQEEIRSTLEKMKKDGKICPKDARLFAIRRVASELAKRGQADLINENFYGQIFEPGEETLEAMALVAIEIKRVKSDFDVSMAKESTKSSKVAQSYFESADNPKAAVDKARTSTEGFDTRLRTIALVAEWSADPGEAVKAAAELVTGMTARDSVAEFTLVRLGAQAGRANQPKNADMFADKAAKKETKIWLKGESLRNLLPFGYKDKLFAEDDLDKLPTDPKDFRAGHAWARLALARHNAGATGDQSKLTVAKYDGWGKGTFKPFGLAGLALGLQDREKR